MRKESSGAILRSSFDTPPSSCRIHVFWRTVSHETAEFLKSRILSRAGPARLAVYTLPVVGLFEIQPIMKQASDFPAADGPSIQTNSPCSISRIDILQRGSGKEPREFA